MLLHQFHPSFLFFLPSAPFLLLLLPSLLLSSACLVYNELGFTDVAFSYSSVKRAFLKIFTFGLARTPRDYKALSEAYKNSLETLRGDTLRGYNHRVIVSEPCSTHASRCNVDVM